MVSTLEILKKRKNVIIAMNYMKLFHNILTIMPKHTQISFMYVVITPTHTRIIIRFTEENFIPRNLCVTYANIQLLHRK